MNKATICRVDSNAKTATGKDNAIVTVPRSSADAFAALFMNHLNLATTHAEPHGAGLTLDGLGSSVRRRLDEQDTNGLFRFVK